ncbi:MAG: AAA family ATPase [candidate division NC10 bacterium]
MNEGKRWRALIFSPPKIGKSSWAETCVGPRLIIDAEGGTQWLANPTIPWDDVRQPPPDVSDPSFSNHSVVVHVTKWQDMETINQWLQSGKHSFKSVVVDSITEIQQTCKHAIETGGGFRIQDWGTLYDMMSPVFKELRDLTYHPTNPVWQVIVTALAKTEDGVIMPDIQGKMARSLPAEVDTVGFLRVSGSTDNPGGRELVVDAAPGLYAGDRTKALRRAFDGVIPISLDDNTDLITYNATQLLRFLNGDPEWAS